MKKTVHNIHAASLGKIFKKLKKIEETHQTQKISGLSMSSFLLANSEFSEACLDIVRNTKIVILQIAGNFTTSPNDLSNSTKLKSNLGYGNDEFTLLQIRLNKLVKQCKPSTQITPSETNKCETVGQCITLVNSKI